MNSETTVTKWSQPEVEAIFKLIDSYLPTALDAVSGGSIEIAVATMAYLLTAFFSTHPHLYPDFIGMLADMEPAYNKLLQAYVSTATGAEQWASRTEEQVFVVLPAHSEMPAVSIN